MGEPAATGDASRRGRALPHLLGLAYVIVAGVALVVPALIHGDHLGPFDILSQYGLTKVEGVVPHNTWVADQIDSMMPWTNLAWTQVHHGQIPLWNPFAGLGMPLAFNWQSAPFGLPALVGYLVPVQHAFTVGVIVTLIVAGTGGYLLGRVLGLGVLGCTLAGTAFELSGPFVAWLGWPHAAVFSWAGWLFAASILIVHRRRRRRVQSIVLFAVVLALAVVAGQPEILVVLLFSLGVFLLVLLALRIRPHGLGSVVRNIGDLVIATVAGGALSAPLALPALQLFSGSLHSNTAGETVLPVENLVHVILQGFDGLPIAGSRSFGGDGPYYVGAYVGIIVLVLAVVAVAARRRPPEVVALAAMALVSAGVVFVPFMIAAMDDLPLGGSVGWTRAQIPMAFALAILGGCGLDVLVRARGERLWRWAGAGFALMGGVLVVLFLTSMGGLTAVEQRLRARSFIWPTVEAVVGLAVIGGFILVHRRRRHEHEGGVGGEADPSPTGPVPTADRDGPRRFGVGPGSVAGFVLLICETLFLVTAGAPLFSSSSSYFVATPSVTALQRDVGSSEVGLGPNPYLCLGLGIIANANDVFDVHELAIYDPTMPKRYFDSFQQETGQSAGFPLENEYCPALTSSSSARLYGVAYVLESRGAPGLAGSTFVAQLGDEDLYHVAGSYPATLSPVLADGSLPAATAEGSQVHVGHPTPATWKMHVDASTAQVLRLRLADVPGWHASIDGKPLSLEPFSGIMLQARIPPGDHTVELSYWPTTFTLGIILGVCAFVGLCAALIIDGARRRRRQDRGATPAGSAP